jgi:hypothetical protein
MDIYLFKVKDLIPIIASAFSRNKTKSKFGNRKESNPFPRKVTDPNKFLKILIESGVNYKDLANYSWKVIELSLENYHCQGDHPVAKRIDIYNNKLQKTIKTC